MGQNTTEQRRSGEVGKKKGGQLAECDTLDKGIAYFAEILVQHEADFGEETQTKDDLRSLIELKKLVQSESLEKKTKTREFMKYLSSESVLWKMPLLLEKLCQQLFENDTDFVNTLSDELETVFDDEIPEGLQEELGVFKHTLEKKDKKGKRWAYTLAFVASGYSMTLLYNNEVLEVKHITSGYMNI